MTASVEWAFDLWALRLPELLNIHEHSSHSNICTPAKFTGWTRFMWQRKLPGKINKMITIIMIMLLIVNDHSYHVTSKAFGSIFCRKNKIMIMINHQQHNYAQVIIKETKMPCMPYSFVQNLCCRIHICRPSCQCGCPCGWALCTFG